MSWPWGAAWSHLGEGVCESGEQGWEIEEGPRLAQRSLLGLGSSLCLSGICVSELCVVASPPSIQFHLKNPGFVKFVKRAFPTVLPGSCISNSRAREGSWPCPASCCGKPSARRAPGLGGLAEAGAGSGRETTPKSSSPVCRSSCVWAGCVPVSTALPVSKRGCTGAGGRGGSSSPSASAPSLGARGARRRCLPVPLRRLPELRAAVRLLLNPALNQTTVLVKYLLFVAVSAWARGQFWRFSA